MAIESVRDVVFGGFCVGCGGCAVKSEGAIVMGFSEDGSAQPDLRLSDPSAIDLPQACPFSDASPNENELSVRFDDGNHSFDNRIGHYTDLAAGRLSDDLALQESSSGGLTSWLVAQLMERDLVDGVIHVGREPDGQERLFGYVISRGDVLRSERRKSVYYSTHMAAVLQSIVGDGKRYAIVGVPCFIKAVSILMSEIPDLDQQIRFRVGLVCGHLKTSAFAEALAWQADVPPTELLAFDFRVKVPGEPANAYRHAALSSHDHEWHKRQTNKTLGGNWGHGMFQLNACNFCDDIFAETADVCFGDAWLPRYSQDSRGTNLIVSRNPVIDAILSDGKASGAIGYDAVTPDEIALSQAGNFRHRWDGLSVRLADDRRLGRSVPTKRIAPGSRPVPRIRRTVIRLRRAMGELSHAAFRRAKAANNFSVFQAEMEPHVLQMTKLGRLEKRIGRVPIVRNIAKRLNII
jgi:coenzyme F420-reducing hydrogenase beta subunit